MGLRRASLAAGAALLAIGLLGASPFLCRGLVGTGEAYNYGLSVADAVEQMRAGVLPPLAGQTEHAFNGRIHPLRTAPYLFYLARAIDLGTLGRLRPWELQNASLTLSLVAAVVACYLGLRWATGCPRPSAVLLSGVYGLSAPLLSAAHQGDLFMTVHAAPFVALAVAACLRGCREPSFSNDAWLAAALAAAWLAHPPVALWATAATAFVRALAFLRRPAWRVLASASAAVLLGAALAAFVFASAATLNADLGVLAAPSAAWDAFSGVIMTNLRSAFPGALLPVSRQGAALADFQLGYVPWVLGVLTGVLALRRPRAGGPDDSPERFAAGAAVLAAAVLLVLVLPVPLLTPWLWRHMPGAVLELVSAWPMQRIYLVAAAFTVFGAGLLLPGSFPRAPGPAWAARAAIALGAAWTLYQAEPFLARGFLNRWTTPVTESAFRPSNTDLTITSYSFLGLPPTFNYGVMDPRFEFRVLRAGRQELTSNLAAALADSRAATRGELQAAPGSTGAAGIFTGKVTLLPGHRYLLEFSFRRPPAPGLILLNGAAIRRSYALPSAGQAEGFGMLAGQRRAVPVWTDLDRAEEVEIRAEEDVPAGSGAARAAFAGYTLYDVDMGALPVRLTSFLPLRFTAEAPEAGCAVETPRRYLAGYEAAVNGAAVEPLASPFGQVMVPVPRGHSEVELRYRGPPLARGAFWLSAASWVAFLGWKAAGSRFPRLPVRATARCLRAPGRVALRHPALAAGALAAALAAGALLMRHGARQAYLRSVGPVRIDFTLPFGPRGANQPLLATGRTGAGVVVFATIVDGDHIRLGADVWGRLYQSGPIGVDPFRVQTLVVSHSALYPPDHPATRALDPAMAERLRGEVRVELNGTTAIAEKAYGFESTPAEVRIGKTDIGSTTGPRFLGHIIRAQRLPVPQALYLRRGRHAELRVRFPRDRAGASEPLASVHNDSFDLSLYVSYLGGGRLRLWSLRSDGLRKSSGELAPDPSREHVLAVGPDGVPGVTSRLGVSCSLDAVNVLGSAVPVAPNAPSLLRSGLNDFGAAGVDARFTGERLELVSAPDAPGLVAPRATGPLHLVVTLPAGRIGRHEPIVTSGRTGAGDFVYIVYEDDRHVRIGFDHWGGAGALSAPIGADYSAPHDILVRMGALYPGLADDAAWAGLDPAVRTALTSRVVASFDNRTLIDLEAPTYPSSPAEVTVGRNAIGGSTEDPEFGGVIRWEERMGLAAPAR